MSESLAGFTGEALYLDTMLPYALLRGVDAAARNFFERIERGAVSAYTLALSFDELAHRLPLALIRDHYGGAPLDMLRSDESRLITELAPSVPATYSTARPGRATGRTRVGNKTSRAISGGE